MKTEAKQVRKRSHREPKRVGQQAKKSSTNPLNPAFTDHAELFTRIFSNRRNPEMQAEWLASEIRKHLPGARDVIELGCGAGQVCVALSRHAYHVTGVDRSPAMIALARRLHGEPLRTRWLLRDFMLDASGLGGDTVLLLYSIIQTFVNEADQLACLRIANSLLPARGLLFVEATNDPAARQRYPQGVTYESEYAGFQVTSWSKRSKDGAKSLHFVVRPRGASDSEAVTLRHVLRFGSQEKIARLLRCSGFTIVTWRSSPDYWAPFDEAGSLGVLAVAAKS